jgi:hypothetical protein
MSEDGRSEQYSEEEKIGSVRFQRLAYLPPILPLVLTYFKRDNCPVYRTDKTGPNQLR